MDNSFTRYAYVLVIIILVSFGGWEAEGEVVKLGCLPTDGIKPENSWLMFCASDRVGSTDQQVVWFDAEPSIRPAVLAADVLFFGDSRIEFAISRGGGSQWFSSRASRFYLLAFGSGEESGWADRLLKKYKPHPAVIVFNADPYFTGDLSPAAQAIVADPEKELGNLRKTRAFLDRAEVYCRYLSWLCGRTTSTYRAYLDGHLISETPERVWFGKPTTVEIPVHKAPPWDKSLFDVYLRNARSVIARSGVKPECVVFTSVPNDEEDDELAKFLAGHLGATAVVPRVEGLKTSDGRHLITASAQIWTPLFLNAMEPVLKRCSDQRFARSF